MNIIDILQPHLIQFQVSAKSKKSILELLSKTLLSELKDHNQHQIFDAFLARERISSTAIGKGIAIPHARIIGNTKTIAAFITIKEPINFDSPDDQPVHSFFALLVPENSTQEHLKILATLAKFFKSEENRDLLQKATSSESLYEILCKG